jgi:hypothetical protein
MLDDLTKKFFCQFDDEMPGVRQNALEASREHLLKQTPPRRFRDLVADLEKAVSRDKFEELERKLADYIAANDKARRVITALKSALWVKTNWKWIGAGAVALLALAGGYWAYDRYWSRSDAVNAGLKAAVASASWAEGWGEPLAAKIGGEPYWLLFRGDINASSYSDNHGRPVEMRCLHLFASPAQPDSGQFFKPSPRLFGWMKWPELAMNCKPSPDQRADK